MSLVGAFAASHAPGITARPSLPPAGESEPIFRAYDELRSRLEAARPDVLVVVSPEHWANFFLDNMPSFCIGIAEEFFGPTDEKFVNIPRRSVRGNARLARALAEGIAEEVDLSTSQEMALDHGVMLPLHLLRTELPVIPIIVNCLAGMPAPLHRCHSLGVAIRRTVDGWPERVALLGTGGLSHWPAMPESGRIGIDFDRRFIDAFLNGRIESFLQVFQRETRSGSWSRWARDPHLDYHRRRREWRRTGSLLAYQPVPAWSTGCAVAVLEIERAVLVLKGTAVRTA